MPDSIFLTLLGFLIVFSCLSHGAVTILPLTITESLIWIIVIIWLLEMVYRGQLSFKKTKLLLPILLFSGVVVFQLVPLPLDFIKLVSINTFHLYEKFTPNGIDKSLFSLSIYPYSTFWELIKLASYIGLFFFIVNRFENKKQINSTINLIIFFGLFVSVYGLIQKYTGHESNSFGPFGNRNNFAGYINMIIPLSLGYFLTDMPISKRLVYAFSTGVMIVALFLSASRAGVLVFVAVLLFVLFFLRLKESLKSRTAVLTVWFIVTISLFAFFMNSGVVWGRLITLFDKNTYVIFGHGYSWLDVLRICKDFPIFGTGLGTFGSISDMYKTTPIQVFFSEAHNDYLQLLSEVGLAGTVFAVLFFYLYFKYSIKSWLERRNPYVVCLMLGGMCSILGMLVYSFLDFNLQIPANAILFFVIMGLVYKLSFLKTKDAIS